jgi:hypothetical protein
MLVAIVMYAWIDLRKVLNGQESANAVRNILLVKFDESDCIQTGLFY